MKRIFFYLIIVCFSYFLLEISSFTLYYLITHKFFTFPKYTSIKEDSDIPDFGNNSKPLVIINLNIHPYLGFVITPRLGSKPWVSDFIFGVTNRPIQTRTNDKVIIGIFGGSVANQLGDLGIDAIETELRKSGLYKNKKIIFVNLGVAGYKQPQQLLALNYLLALGGAFDIVINLDGFNDITLPVIENIPHHIFPFFPRSWDDLVATESINYDKLRIIYKAHAYEKIQVKLTRIFLSSPLRYSITGNLFFDGIEHSISNKIAILRLEIFNEKNNSKRYAVTGPTRTYKNNKEMYEDLAMVWKNSSLQMSKICASNHTAYFHFLQPNQYVPNSKIINEEEKKIAFLTTFPSRKPVEEGYPYLRQAGKDLVKEGVNFSDLTYVFAHNDETLYKDICCHFNQKGLDLLGQIIGDTIVKDMHRSPVVPADFDWQQYIANYPDLQRAGINTKEKAERHWIDFGYFENRSYKTSQGVDP